MSHGLPLLGAIVGVAIAVTSQPVSSQVAMASAARPARAPAPIVAPPTSTAHPADETSWLEFHPWPSPEAAMVQGDGLPPNLQLPTVLREAVEHMWDHSPTFRYQCARLAADRSLTVVVALGAWTERVRGHARSSLRATGGKRRANVLLRTFDDPVLWLAHEIEHILEWIDGANYALARQSIPAGYECHGDDVETARALRAGERVALEAGARR